MKNLFAFLAILAFAVPAFGQSVRLYSPETSVVVGDTVSVFLYATPPSWADTLSGVHARVLDFDHAAMTFLDGEEFYPTAWAGNANLVNSGCGTPDELTNDPYVYMAGYDTFPVGGECPVVVGACADSCFYANWDPWDTGGNEVLAARVRFVVNTEGQTEVGFAECSNEQFRNYLTWIEWNNDCLTEEWQPDIVGNNLYNDPTTTVTVDHIIFSVTSGGGGHGGGHELEKPVGTPTTWSNVKERYKDE
jgi:hypothetical protein